MRTIVIKLTVQGDEEGALRAANAALDAGTVQDAVRDADLEGQAFKIRHSSAAFARRKSAPTTARGARFVEYPRGEYTCGDCLPDGVDVTDPQVHLWETHTSGWSAPIACRRCKVQIPIRVDSDAKETSHDDH